MAPKTFRTDRRLWLLISAALFVPPWFFWRIGKYAENEHAIDLFRLFFTEDKEAQSSIFLGIICFSLLFGVVALVLGWVLHSVVVVVRDRLRNA